MQGFNMGRYVPPDKEGVFSFNQASGKKPIKRSPDGSQTVRFECPFAIWCTNCDPETIIGQGVRFNAEKKKVGNYYSTPIWSFRIKHTVCGGWIEVQTDPKNTEYLVVSGGRKRNTGAGKLLEGEILLGRTEEEKEEAAKDGAFGILEEKKKDKEVADEQQVRIVELQKKSEQDWADPYTLNKKIRQDFRVGRRQRQADQKSGEVLQDKFGLGLDLVAPEAEDIERVRIMDFGLETQDRVNVRGIFDSEPLPVAAPVKKDREKRGKKQDVAAERKSALQNNLRGNTRATLDPFLKNEAWQPTKKRKAELGTVEVPRFDAIEPTIVRETETTTTAALVAYDSD